MSRFDRRAPVYVGHDGHTFPNAEEMLMLLKAKFRYLNLIYCGSQIIPFGKDCDAFYGLVETHVFTATNRHKRDSSEYHVLGAFSVQLTGGQEIGASFQYLVPEQGPRARKGEPLKEKIDYIHPTHGPTLSFPGDMKRLWAEKRSRNIGEEARQMYEAILGKPSACVTTLEGLSGHEGGLERVLVTAGR
ncbi:hypothetical protein HYU11_05160 [Candidatus Woesearchaeota archaeon]|nr:hypothetical protein [Candidatus Woesearchaeota archaeon]